MSLNLDNERLIFRRITTENSAETVVEGTVTLPNGAPEVGRTLKVDAVPELTELEVKDGKVIFEGVLDVTLLYAHFEERQVLPDDEDSEADEYDDEVQSEREPEIVVEERLEKVSWEQELPFAFLLELPGATEEDEGVETDVVVRECSCELRSDRTTVDVDVVLSFEAAVATTEEINVAQIADAPDDVEVETKEVRIKSLIGTGQTEATASGSLSLTGRAVPETLLEVGTDVAIGEALVDEGTVRIKGTVTYSIFYVGAEGAGPQYGEWPRGTSFEAEISVPGARRGARAAVTARPGAGSCRLTEGEEGRTLEVSTPITLDVVVDDVREVALVTGVTSERMEVATRAETIYLYEAVGEGAVEETAEASLDLPEGAPGIDRILFGSAKAVVDDVHVLGDRVAVELHTDVDLVYVGRTTGEGGVSTIGWPSAVALDLEIPIEGAEPGLDRHVVVDVASVEFDLINRESVDVRVGVRAKAELSRELEAEVVVEAVEVPPADPNPPTYTFVVAREGDTVWKLAARYRSQADVIVESNDWVDSVDSSLTIGRKVCVPRKAANSVA